MNIQDIHVHMHIDIHVYVSMDLCAYACLGVPLYTNRHTQIYIPTRIYG